jgi:branched-chain amino acid transport system ATP-binding protein
MSPAGRQTLLKAEGLAAWYGAAQILFGIDLHVERGEVVALMGRNGAGKSTTLKALMGILDKRGGTLAFLGHDISNAEPYEVARLGLGYVPEDRRIFTGLTVRENLEVGRQRPRAGAPRWTTEALFGLFPNLADVQDRPGASISGGEQQMLAIARVLRTGASLFLLDEPTEGLAPVIVQQIGAAIELMKQEGHTILLVEQNFRFATRIADRHYVMERGRIIDQIPRAEIAARETQIQQYLGI